MSTVLITGASRGIGRAAALLFGKNGWNVAVNYRANEDAARSLKQELEDAVELYNEYYKDSPFVFISSKGVSLKEVVNTNKILLHIELHQGYIHISSVIDNLVKGASGQAVENMNLIFGLEQTMGLKLKPSAF